MKKALTLAEVFHPLHKSSKTASRIIRDLTGVTSGSTKRAEFAFAHTLTSRETILNCSTRQSRKFGFTLAEVLITLGIIGIVAALTIPNIVQNYKRKSYSTQLKKTYNTVVNAFRMSELYNGDMKTWVIPIRAVNTNHKEFFDNYIKPYINYSNIKYGSSPIYAEIKVYLIDGSTINFYRGGVYDIIMDINGDKKPNEAGRDIFSAYIVNNQIGNYRNVSRETAKTRCNKNSGVDMAGYCFLLLKYDNFEFKDDYPIKL